MTKMTIPEAAESIGRVPATLYVAIRKGTLKATSKYGVLLIEESEVQRYAPTTAGRPRSEPKRLRTDISQSELAREMGVSRQRVNQILNREAHWARLAVRKALLSGKILKPETCERCEGAKSRLEAHHPDYSKRLDVQWLCPPCHSLIHPHAPNKNGKNGHKKASK